MTIRARLYLVRHGETAANKERIIQGQLDVPLNDHGLKQARELGKAMQSVKFDAAYTSDLCRAAVTAQEAIAHQPEVVLIRTQELRERHMGSLQGRPGSEWRGNAQGMEASTALMARALTWWDRMLAENGVTRQGEEGDVVHILAVSHGGWIGTLLRGLIERKWAKCGKGVSIGETLNCSVTIIEVKHDRSAVIAQFGGVSHLDHNDDVVVGNADEQAVKK
ncbi:phosphoglycerate mutase-like protein [Pluteus cervinus]|uniref:Phosphoglycerate mutase-like protein n=1 Tax=Pluteus cervinus TaxID=181527 RepID=A0ACD3BGQ8_9AGAR|nr:phosphoglycerate mutase-like protein [Pluteus cervinus]